MILSEILVLRQKVERLEIGQLEIKKEQYMINRQIADTYKLALDAWGQGVENRSWILTCYWNGVNSNTLSV